MIENSSSIYKFNEKLSIELSSHFEEEHNMPPLASKIYSILILSQSECLTFDEILTITKASKSSVSNQINFLIDEGRVEFIFKDKKRKRYFKTKEDYFKKTLEIHQQKIQKETNILSKIIDHKKDQGFDGELASIFKGHLLNEKENLEQTIYKLSQTSNNIKTHEE
jgi:DNA-binding transcriptional regulator GbsR (MarR family)